MLPLNYLLYLLFSCLSFSTPPFIFNYNTVLLIKQV
ncbi:hypothetical protein [Staphylococcus phage vB_SauM-V1SA22]|nr:hypothetical protein [Staphylococcus phage vB_SauM-V1SA22]